MLPVDASGTGILQAAQVLAYIGVYSPRLLILDEPDAHLHPDNQRKLVRLLNEVAQDDGVQVLMLRPTHALHALLRGRIGRRRGPLGEPPRHIGRSF